MSNTIHRSSVSDPDRDPMDPYHLVGSGSVSESVDKSKSLYFLKFLIVLLHFARFRNI